MSLLAIERARRWLGTPFCAGASVCGVGTDCAGLIEGIARDLGQPFPSRRNLDQNILAAAQAFLVAVQEIIPGNVILLARDPGGQPLHAALVTNTHTLIHAHWQAGVVENRFGTWFQRRMTHAFAWPVQPPSTPHQSSKVT
jgi:NlpC/P60 family putative phage cell wall peptidase